MRLRPRVCRPECAAVATGEPWLDRPRVDSSENPARSGTAGSAEIGFLATYSGRKLVWGPVTAAAGGGRRPWRLPGGPAGPGVNAACRPMRPPRRSVHRESRLGLRVDEKYFATEFSFDWACCREAAQCRPASPTDQPKAVARKRIAEIDLYVLEW
jgi:hypothetical protein